jgi:Arc/MetJ family transcription regulator
MTSLTIYQKELSKMETIIDLPDELIAEAMQLTDVENKTQVIIIALQELVKKNKFSDLRKFKGAVDLNINLDTLRNRETHFS